MGSYLQRRTVGGSGPGGEWPACDSTISTKLPALAEFLAADKWGDGADRVPGTILIFVDAGTLKACINDKDQDAVAFLTARTMQELLESIEAGLRSGKLDWRAQRAPGGRGGKRR